MFRRLYWAKRSLRTVPSQGKIAQIHVKLSDATHRRLKVRAAARGLTVQDYVVQLLEKDLKDVNLEEFA